LVASPIYFTMPRHGFDKAFYERSMFSGKPLETERYILVADSAFKKIMSNTERRSSTVMKSFYDNSQTIDTLVPDDKTKYNFKKYPYSNMRQNPGAAKEIEIRSNY
jgi:hypothetical protein